MSLISAGLSALSQWYGGVKPLVWPTARPYKQNAVVSAYSLFMPDTVTNDGSVFRLQNGTVTRIGATGATVYTVNPTDIDASAGEISGMAIDSANSRLYMLASWGGTNQRLAFTPLATKSITARTAQAVTHGSRVCFIRAANGVDFLNYTGSGTSIASVHTITESTGAISAATAFTLGGVTPRISNVGANRHAYVTQDAQIAMQTDGAYFMLNRGGGFSYLPMQTTNYGYGPDLSNTQGCMTSGDGLVTMFGDGGGEKLFPKTYVRAEFDAFLHRLCDFAGLPR
ncbi:MAG: hypothetical protein ING73_11215 [Rhodocyclaceae bacterium]|nr:hypothetical protein [Rhodocyclaceae bacterium]